MTDVTTRCSYAFAVGEDSLIGMSVDADLAEHQKHIAQTRAGFEGYSLCGQDIQTEWAFQGVDHAFNNAATGGRLTVCPVCASIVKTAMEIE